MSQVDLAAIISGRRGNGAGRPRRSPTIPVIVRRSSHLYRRPAKRVSRNPAAGRSVSAVATFEDDADLEALADDPLLQFDELDMKARQLALIFLALQLAADFKLLVLFVGHWFHSSNRMLVIYTLTLLRTRAMIEVTDLATYAAGFITSLAG